MTNHVPFAYRGNLFGSSTIVEVIVVMAGDVIRPIILGNGSGFNLSLILQGLAAVSGFVGASVAPSDIQKQE